MIAVRDHDFGRRSAVVGLGTLAVAAVLLFAAALIPFRHPEPPTPAPVTIEAGVIEPSAPPQPQPLHQPPPPQAERQPQPPPKPVKLQPPRQPTTTPRPPSAPTEPPRSAASPPPPLAQPPEEDGLSGGTGAARAIIQPTPVIPPELRRHVMNLVAIVRFTIAADGAAKAELEEATPDPRLNQVLLDAFQRWRFFPATEHGKPVASTLTLRVPVRVE